MIRFSLFLLLFTQLFANRNDIILSCLQESYPSVHFTLENNLLHINQDTFPFDDGMEKNETSILENPDIEDMFAYIYPLGFQDSYPDDPGRIRHEGFFKALYGKTKTEVETRITAIHWMDSKPLRLTRTFGVHQHAQRLSNALLQLSQKEQKMLHNHAGGFYWRKVSGTERLSAHSFGIALDTDTRYGNYWKWDMRSRGKMHYQNRLSRKSVALFEQHGFIWGGKWKHYDTFHFEYRPELLCFSRQINNKTDVDVKQIPML